MKRLETYSTHPFDHSLGPLLRPLMLLTSQGKVTHFWHWHDLPSWQDYQGQLLPGDKEAPSINLGQNPLRRRWNELKMGLGGCKNCFILEPDFERADSVISQMVKDSGWRYGYQYIEGGKRAQYCSVIARGPIRILQGPEQFRAFGLTARHSFEVPVKASGPFSTQPLPIF